MAVSGAQLTRIGGYLSGVGKSLLLTPSAPALPGAPRPREFGIPEENRIFGVVEELRIIPIKDRQ